MEIRMMKKTKQTYVQPTCEVVELHVTNQLLNGSPEPEGKVESPNNYIAGEDLFSDY